MLFFGYQFETHRQIFGMRNGEKEDIIERNVQLEKKEDI